MKKIIYIHINLCVSVCVCVCGERERGQEEYAWQENLIKRKFGLKPNI